MIITNDDTFFKRVLKRIDYFSIMDCLLIFLVNIILLNNILHNKTFFFKQIELLFSYLLLLMVAPDDAV